jgi:group I intron endonuclease
METTFIVYEIVNLVNGKKYVGCSADYKSRWKHHKHLLRLNNHANTYLQQSWNKYSENNFEFNILFQFDSETEMFDKEHELITLNRADCYNLSEGGKGGSKGTKWSIESRNKLSESKKKTAKLVMTDEVKKRISESKKGSVMPDNTKQALLKSKQKPVSMYSIRYPSIKDASIALNITNSKAWRMVYDVKFKECYLCK